MLETRMGGVRDIVQELGLPHVLCFQARRMRSHYPHSLTAESAGASPLLRSSGISSWLAGGCSAVPRDSHRHRGLYFMPSGNP